MQRRILLLTLIVPPISLPADDSPVDFNRQIRSLLSDTCFKCHGPDENERQADLRFDSEEGLLGEVDGHRVIVPGNSEQSELFRRITSADADERMPPPDSKLSLTDEQIDLIRRWIEQGAQWQQHWSFVAPKRPTLPAIKAAARNPIDHFVRARLATEGLQPAAEAGKNTLIRRVTLDLTGLPPTPSEVANFLADDSPVAYERLVDRLLDSPRFGERMATLWLDAARYADTSGYQNDGPRTMWRWRDWVIEAYNHGMTFDQFTVEQLAGDLLPKPTLDQRIATGFNRNHRGNSEGGVVAEEFQVEYVVDRVETTSTVWLGLTIGCGRCHDHKYDPISQREFYSLYAFFNNIPENGRAVKEGNSPPFVKAPTREQQRDLNRLENELAAARQEFAKLQPSIDAAEQSWVASVKASESIRWSSPDGLVAHFSLENPETSTNEKLTSTAGDVTYQDGRVGSAAEFDGECYLDAGPIADFGYFDKLSLAAWVYPRGDQGGTIISRMTDEEQSDGYYVDLVDGRLRVNLVKRWLDDCIRIESVEPILSDQWTHVAVAYDGSRLASGIKVYVNGKPFAMKVNFDFINQTFAAKDAPLRLGGGGGPNGRFHGLLDEAHVYERAISDLEAAILSVPETISEIAAIAKADRTDAQQSKLRAYFLSEQAADDVRLAHDKMKALERELAQLREDVPTVMVMEEMSPARETFVLTRGEYDKPADGVSTGVPAIFSQPPHDGSTNRLALAEWLVSPDNPLTARVAVNRYWQMYFGTGLVKTAEDFGTQGERPSHPQLLDWLADEFVRTGWDVKGMQRLIVTSATYRQSSKLTDELLSRDPDNRLLARGPRFRLPAETVRDQALAVSGLLSERLGGPSVKPYQPGDLWQDIATDTDYVQDHGPNLYRRSMYTYWKRTVVPPRMATFDGSGREMCRVLPRRTNTPLQALTLMNDVTFVEAARVLAQRVLREADADPTQRLNHLVMSVLGREPTAAELTILKSGLKSYVERFTEDKDAANELLSTGEYPRDESLEPIDVAAYTALASLILNLDEAVTKQ